jgi:hypothetical protein
MQVEAGWRGRGEGRGNREDFSGHLQDNSRGAAAVAVAAAAAAGTAAAAAAQQNSCSATLACHVSFGMPLAVTEHGKCSQRLCMRTCIRSNAGRRAAEA